ncbi:putative vacuolar protein sorting-associated protein [Helianthus annuus]|nr:putative vacuolar protein sorting-associated protein [Helianthus annuus]
MFVHFTKRTKFLVCVSSLIKGMNTNKLPVERFMNCSLNVWFVCSPMYFGKAIKLLGACEGDALGTAFSEVGVKSEMLSIKLQREGTIAERANAFKQQCELAETIKLKQRGQMRLSHFCSDGTYLFYLYDAEREYEENFHFFVYAIINGMQLKGNSLEATRRFETIVRLMSEEIVRFQEQKTQDMGRAFHEFAKGQARLANAIADAWRSLLPKLESLSVS